MWILSFFIEVLPIAVRGSIKRLFTNINEISRKSLPKFHKDVQSEIKALMYVQRKIGKKQAALDQFMRKKYISDKSNVKYAEDILKRLPKFFSLPQHPRLFHLA